MWDKHAWARRAIAIAVAFLVIGCVACEDIPAPTFPPQTAGTIHLEGDSVTFNTYWATGIPTFNTSGRWDIGSSADYNPYGAPATVRVPQAVSEGTVETLVWALGLNEIYRAPSREWSVKDQNVWIDILFNQVPRASCIVIVKPWVLPIGYNVRPLASINALRSWIDTFAKSRENTVVVDWKPILAANPHFSSVDGVHIEPNTGGPEARDAMYREGLSRCGA